MAKVWSQETREQVELFSKIRAIGIITVVVFLALFAAELLSVVPGVLAEQSTGLSADILLMVSFALSFIGMSLVGLGYLVHTSRGFEYIDLSSPTWKSLKYVLLGGIGSILVFYAINAITVIFELPVADSPVTDQIGGDIMLALMFLIIVFFFNSPAEEFLFRNIVQKRLAEVFNTGIAIVLASVLFALAHLPGYLLLATLVETVVPMLLLFSLSLLLGVIYAYTRELLVVIGVHSLYNAIQVTFIVAVPT